MSGSFIQDGFFENSYADGQSAGYNVGEPNQFDQEPQFGQFDYSQTPPSPYMSQESFYTGSIMTPEVPVYSAGVAADSFEDEPPLMEELGINFDHITQKTMAVLNPLKLAEQKIMQDTDLAGPLVFCLAFGGSLMLDPSFRVVLFLVGLFDAEPTYLMAQWTDIFRRCDFYSGKLHFGYIYGIGVVGCLAMYALLNLMSMTGVSSGCIISVLGYCLLPMVLLSFLSVMISLQGIIGSVLTVVTVLWCSLSASKLFVSALAMNQQQLLVAYPCALVYGVFALLTVF